MHIDADSIRNGCDLGVSTLPVVRPVRVVERANTLANRVHEYIQIGLMDKSLSTVRLAKMHLAKFELYMAGRNFDRPTLMRLASWMKERGASQDSMHRVCSSVQRFIRWLWKLRYIREPMDDAVPTISAPVGKSLAVFITDDEYERFVGRWKGSPMGWAFILSYHTGLRLKDVCCLEWGMVDLVNQVISIRPSKTMHKNISAGIPIITGSDLHVWLLKLHAERVDDGLVCPELWRSYFSRSNPGSALSNNLGRALREVGIKASFHALRGTFESKLANSGISIAVAAKITGRTDPKSLMRYILPDMEHVRSEVAKALAPKEQPIIIHERRNNTETDQSLAGQSGVSTGRGKHSGEVEGVLGGAQESNELPASWLI